MARYGLDAAEVTSWMQHQAADLGTTAEHVADTVVSEVEVCARRAADG